MIVKFVNCEDEAAGMRDSCVTGGDYREVAILIHQSMIPMRMEMVVLFLCPGSFLLIDTSRPGRTHSG